MGSAFPTRLADGSFCVLVALRMDAPISDALSSQIADWLLNWAAANPEWDWFGERVRYSDEFNGAPSEVERVSGTLTFRMHGRASSRWWRDILAYHLLPALRGAVPELGELQSIRDCPSGR